MLSVLHAVHPSKLFDIPQDPAVALDSDSSVSFGSLTDSSVDTASECDKVTLPSLERDGALLPPAVASGADWGGVCTDLSGKGFTVY